MNILDFHAHYFPDDLAPRAVSKLVGSAPGMTAGTDGTLAGLTDSMRRAGIGLAVTLPVATRPSQVSQINESAIALADSRIIPFGALHPDDEDWRSEIDRLSAHGVRGVKLHPEYQNFHLGDRRLTPMYEALQAAGLVTVFHAGKDPGPFTGDHALPAAIRDLSRAFPELTIVAAHMGGYLVWDEVEDVLCGERLYFDTAAVTGTLEPARFVRLCRKHGIERILFGTDSPWFDQKAAVEWIDRTSLTAAEKEAIFFANASSLLGLDRDR